MKTDDFFLPKTSVKYNAYYLPLFLFRKGVLLFGLSMMMFLTVTAFGQWEVVTPPEETSSFQSYTKIAVVDDYKWVLSNREIFKTIDNGQSWSKGNLGTIGNDIHFVNRDTGFVVGDYNNFRKTVDGGTIWTRFILTDDAIHYKAIHFNGSKGWIAGSDGIVLQTEDAGETWSKLVLPYTGIQSHSIVLDNIYFINEQLGFITGKGFTKGFFKTTDGGNSWKYYNYVNKSREYLYAHNLTLSGLYFINELEGYAYNSSQNYKTNDGGLSWQHTDNGELPFGEIRFIFFLNDIVGWIAHGGNISFTRNGGKTWEKQPESTGFYLNDIAIDADQNIWIVGNGNKLYKNRRGSEISVKTNDNFIVNHDSIPSLIDGIDFGQLMDTLIKTFTIYNVNTDTLILNDIMPISVMGSSAFQIIEPPYDTILSGDSTQFKIQYTPGYDFVDAHILIASNAKTDSLFDFAVQGNCESCLIEGEQYLCGNTTEIVYTAPEGMKNYHWELSAWGQIIGADNEQTVTIEIRESSLFPVIISILTLKMEAFNGCKSSCTKEIYVGLPDAYLWNDKQFNVCQNEQNVRFVTPIMDYYDGDTTYSEAKQYKWFIVDGDANINSLDSLSEVFLDVGNSDFTIGLMMSNYPDCEVTLTRKVDVHQLEEYSVCGAAEICKDTEFAVYTAPENLLRYHWTVTSEDTIFYNDSTSLHYHKIDSLSKDFSVKLSTKSTAGCVFESAIMVKTESDCILQSNKIIYVNADLTSGLEDGTSWANAFTNLQDALDIARDSNQIWVAKGIYIPSKDRFGVENPLDAESITFYIDKEIQLFGGFSGNEDTLEARDWEGNKTILSGDLNGDDELVDDILDQSFPANNKEENANSVVYISSGGVHTRLDGVVIQSGNADTYEDNSKSNEKYTGGGMYIKGVECYDGGRVVIENCLFRYNNALQWGGGLAIVSSEKAFITPNLKSCQFRQNNGGGLAISNDISTVIQPTIADCQFIENRGNYGGGLFLSTLAGKNESKLSNCNFERNKSNKGGAIYIGSASQTISSPSFYDCNIIFNDVTDSKYGQGGGIYIANSSTNSQENLPYFERILFYGNKAKTGGAVYTACYNSMLSFYTNCIFSNNTSQEGSVMYNEDSKGSHYPFIYNSTIAFNTSLGGSTFYKDNRAGLFLFTNSIIWNNGSRNFPAQSSKIASMDYTLINDNICPESVSCNEGVIFGTDPLFVDSTSNLSLQFGSPATDVGRNEVALNWRPYDLDFNKNQRIIATYTSDTAIIDLGAYEFQDAPALSVAYDTQLTYQPLTFALDTFYENESRIYTFAMKNVGSQLLSFSDNPIVQITDDTNFHVIQQVTKNELGLLENDSFKIQFNAVATGDYEATVRIFYNSIDSEPYEFKLLMNVALSDEMMTTTCGNELLLDNDVNLSNTYYQAEKTIQSSVEIDSLIFVTFQAGESIALTSGFYAKKGAKFTAEIKEIICEEALSETIQQRSLIDTPKQQYENIALTISPNPFTNLTSINYNLPEDTQINLQIFSLNGQLIQELVPKQWQTKGNYEYQFQPTANAGNIYFAVLTTAKEVISKKMIFIR